MNRIPVLAMLLLGGLSLAAAESAPASTVLCESMSNSYQSCPVDASGGVRLSRQLSSQGCWEGDTWGYDRNKIWVNRGCRAEFEVGSLSTSNSSSTASKNNALAAAAVVGIAAAAIAASNQHDDHHHKNNNYNNNYNYNYNRNYDRDYDRYDDRHYQNSRYGYNGYGGDPRRIFTCESRNDRRTYCNIPARGHVEVYRQRSAKSCTFGRSWGVDGNSVWVRDGCRAEFAVF